jgi:hypothetical protein
MAASREIAITKKAKCGSTSHQCARLGSETAVGRPAAGRRRVGAAVRTCTVLTVTNSICKYDIGAPRVAKLGATWSNPSQ